MKGSAALTVALAAAGLVTSGGGEFAHSQTDPGDSAAVEGAIGQLELTPAQRSAIYAAVGKDQSKTAPQGFSTAIGADVPPMIALYDLPDAAVAADPVVKFYQYTMVQDQVVLVDPTRMRVIGVIGPQPQR